METSKEQSPVRSYDAPAVVYESRFVVYAGSTTPMSCPYNPLGDLLDPRTGQ